MSDMYLPCQVLAVEGLPTDQGKLLLHEVNSPAIVTRRDAKGAGVLGNLGLRHGSAASWHLPTVPALAVTNPPWGQRLMNGDYEASHLR